jgi:thioesterase domain-containing protein
VETKKRPALPGVFCVHPLRGSGLARSLVNTRRYVGIGVTLSLQAKTPHPAKTSPQRYQARQ